MIVYVAENMVDGRMYVGATSATLQRRKIEHKSCAAAGRDRSQMAFHEAIREYGWDTFTWHVVERCSTLPALMEAERRWIGKLGTKDPERGYNRTEGGAGTPGFALSDETRQKLSESLRGRKHSEESRQKRSRALKGRKPSEACMRALCGREVSEETRRKLSAAKAGTIIRLTKEQEALRLTRLRENISRKIPVIDARQVLSRRERGEPLKSIAATYGVSASAVLYYCRRHEGVSS